MTTGNITIHAIYTPIIYTVTMLVDGLEWASKTYTIENYLNITLPAPPEKDGYVGCWEEVEWFIDDTVTVLYTTVGATMGLKFSLINNASAYAVTDYEGTETSIIIPAIYRSLPVTEIQGMVFTENEFVTGIYIPDYIEQIDKIVFDRLPSVERIIVADQNNALTAFCNVLYNKAGTDLIAVPRSLRGSITFPQGMTEIPAYSFGGRPISKVIMHDQIIKNTSYGFK